LNRQVAVALGVLAMVVIIVGVDFLFLRGHFWLRLAVNVAIVVLFAALYFRFLKRM
jgi:hypothetical protein